MTELELRLSALRDELAWPPTPALAAATAERIAAEPGRRERRRWPWPASLAGRPRLATATALALAVVVAAGALLAASSDVRARVADWLGIGSVRIERVERLPRVGPGDDLRLGAPTTLAGARRAVSVPVPTIGALGRPDGVYVGETVGGRSVSLVYRAGPSLPPSVGGVGALLTVLPGEDGLILARKTLDPRARLRTTRVGAAAAVFVEGRHVLIPPRRLAGNTLIWVAGGATYRLETELGLAGALRLARSVH